MEHVRPAGVLTPVLTDATAMRRIALEANADDACLGIIGWKDTFRPAKMWITVLNSLDKPQLHLHTQPDEALPWSTTDMDFTKLTRTAHRDRESRFVQTRLSVPGRPDLATMRAARCGHDMRDVAVTEGDKVEACGTSPR